MYLKQSPEMETIKVSDIADFVISFLIFALRLFIPLLFCLSHPLITTYFPW